jgi:hypothetical protein
VRIADLLSNRSRIGGRDVLRKALVQDFASLLLLLLLRDFFDTLPLAQLLFN